MPLPFHRRRLDPDAADFCRRSGATDRAAINAFVRGVKDLGLWDSMVCWPLRSTQNAGTGTKAYSLGGLGSYDGTLTNGLTWGADGVTADANNEKLTTSFNFATALTGLFAVISPVSAASNPAARVTSNDQVATTNGLGIDTFGENVFRRLGASIGTFGTRAASTRTMVGVGNGASNSFNFQDGTRSSLSNLSYNASAQTLCPVGAPQTDTALGTYSFTMALDGVAPSADALSSLYALYKSTLGTGLGLP